MDESFGTWPLLNGLEVTLTVGSAAADVAQRFVDLFRAGWSRIPATVQNALMRNWQSSKDGSATFLLFYDLADHAPGIGTYGIYTGPARFDFSAAKLRNMPDCLVETLIAHELGHCYLGHSGDYSTANEAEADKLVESWGFPMDDLRDFLEP